MTRRQHTLSVSTHRPRSIVAALALGILQVACAGRVAAPVPPPPTAASPTLAPDSPARPFLGTYQFAGGDKERAAVTKAIDDGVTKLEPIIRGFARWRLTAANGVPQELVFLGGAEWFEVRVDGRRYVSRTDGGPYSVETSSGDVMDLRYKFGEKLEQTFSDPSKQRINTFELKDDRLIMHVRVTADVLPQEIHYELTFERSKPTKTSGSYPPGLDERRAQASAP